MPIRDILNRLSDDNRRRLGVAATLLQYAIYAVLLMWLDPSLSMSMGYAVSFVFNFMATTRYTFKVKANARRGAGFALSHAVNYMLQMVTLNLFLWFGVDKHLAPIPMFAICVPVNFILVRFFIKK